MSLVLKNSRFIVTQDPKRSILKNQDILIENGKISELANSIEGEYVMPIDDVADRGTTLQFVKKYLKEKGAREITYTTLAYKPWSIIKPDFYEIETQAWIIFPWEWEIKETIQDLSNNGKNNIIQKIFTEDEIRSASP